MNLLQKQKAWILFVVMVLVMVAGCGKNKNFFAPLHSDGVESNASVLVADGKAALDRGDYEAAEKYFGLAKFHNPKNSEALVGYAEAYLKKEGFSLGTLITSLLNRLEDLDDGSGSTLELVQPADWGQDSVADLMTLFNTVIETLEPIPAGQAEGPISSLDVDVNATSGLFYLLSFALDVEALSTDYQLQTLDRTDPDVIALIDPAILAQLPDEFLWFVNETGGTLTQPPISFINTIEYKLNTGLERLNQAAANTSSEDIVKMITELFEDWDTLADQI